MHSRVAVVKAPRTHNRRRVTGSSGRRREGRESERQRPNMSRHHFYSAAMLLLLFFVMMCCGSGIAQAEAQKLSDLKFNWKGITECEGVTANSLGVPSLLKVGNDVFAVAEAQCTRDKNCSFTGIASELLTLTDERPKELDTSKLKTHVLGNCSSEEGKCPSQAAVLAGTQEVKEVHVRRPTTFVNGSDIYMLAGNYSWAYEAKKDSVFGWGLLLVKGNISNGEGSNKRIQWNENYDIPWTSSGRENRSWTRLIGGGGSGIKTKGGTFLFPVEGTRKEDGKAVSLIMYSSDTAGWTLSREMSDDGCSDPSVAEWKGKLMMMTACDDGRRRVYEFTLTESWTEALGTLSRVWSNKHKGQEKGIGSGFITATIENRDVMLVTLPVYSEKKGKAKEKGELHLWLTDNTHIADIGPVSGNDDDAAASSLLYKRGNGNKEELIALYEKKKGGEGKTSTGVVSVRLTEQLKRVKKVVKTWKEVDERVSKLCSSSAAKGTSTGTACSAAMPRTGLVGFLSGSFSGDTWRDEYLGVNAIISSGVGMESGVTFTGRGAGAEWPVGKQGENQLYQFANYNFTLVATVSIHKAPKGVTPIPLMGVHAMDGNGGKSTVLLGLSYSKEKKWKLLCSDGEVTEHSSRWEPDTTHQVAIVLQNGNQSSVYVDGKIVGASCELKVMHSKAISHFYIGGDGGSAGSEEDVPVTVTNVLLYNRLLNGTEIGVLNANKISIPKLKDLQTRAARTSSPAVSRSNSSAEVLVAGTTSGVTARHVGVHRDGCTVCGSGLLLLLLLLGLWGLAAP
ncbi:trans-sialidase, putative [Trypanosoma cruzi marinkellei]|uniref:Trans-sialidase, putative n=1 Tax=Trypanosoma cruzi marinkellei TaxID=85056 RepID=K2NBE9_TRYCR|nr:trans-sialidase, putative [Trypanosoma cruzi marinkellei]